MDDLVEVDVELGVGCWCVSVSVCVWVCCVLHMMGGVEIWAMGLGWVRQSGGFLTRSVRVRSQGMGKMYTIACGAGGCTHCPWRVSWKGVGTLERGRVR